MTTYPSTAEQERDEAAAYEARQRDHTEARIQEMRLTKCQRRAVARWTQTKRERLAAGQISPPGR